MGKNLAQTLWLWIKDAVEVAVTLGVILIILRVIFGSHTLVPLVVVTSNSMLHLNDDWVTWLTEHEINESMVSHFPLKRGFTRGDMILTIAPDKYGLFSPTKIGDVVIYQRDIMHLNATGSVDPIIHRVVGIVRIDDWEVVGIEGTSDCLKKEDFTKHIQHVRNCIADKGLCPYPSFPDDGNFNFYMTKGDNNPATDQCGFNGGIALPVNEAQLTARGWIRIPYIGYVKLLFNLILRILFFWL